MYIRHSGGGGTFDIAAGSSDLSSSVRGATNPSTWDLLFGFGFGFGFGSLGLDLVWILYVGFGICYGFGKIRCHQQESTLIGMQHIQKKSLGFGTKVLVFGFGFVLEQK